MHSKFNAFNIAMFFIFIAILGLKIRLFIATEARSSLPSIKESNPGENEPQDGRKAKGKPT